MQNLEIWDFTSVQFNSYRIQQCKTIKSYDLFRLQIHIKLNVKSYYDCIVNNVQYIFIMYHSCNKLGRAVSLILIIALL